MLSSHKMSTHGFDYKSVQDPKRTERALRWLVVLSISLVSLVSLAKWEQNHKLHDVTAHYSSTVSAPAVFSLKPR